MFILTSRFTAICAKFWTCIVYTCSLIRFRACRLLMGGLFLIGVIIAAVGVGIYMRVESIVLVPADIQRLTNDPYKLGIQEIETKKTAFIAPRNRYEIGELLESYGYKGEGAEVGVAEGHFSESVLKYWKSCKRYHLIDPWGEEKHYQNALRRLKPYSNKTKVMRMIGKEAAKQIQNKSLDFIYIDAMHDYCSVKIDLDLFWPKLVPGGIFAGHDYLSIEGYREGHEQLLKDLGTCPDGTFHWGGPRQAVNEFAVTHDLSLSATYINKGGDYEQVPSWILRKPFNST